MVGEVRTRTARAVQAVEALERRIEVLAAEEGDAEQRRALVLELRENVSRWVREMEALGVRVRGPWKVEFESETGAFCWAWPEPALSRFRSDEATEPMPIQ